MSGREQLQTIKTISYGDFAAHLFLWQKAFLLVPLWAIAVVPIIGFISRSMGNAGTQIGFGVVLCYFAIYFLEDLLKRKIRMDEDYVYFGFRALPIKEINSVEATYSKNKFLPGALTITTQSGQRLKFNLNGMTEEGVQTLIKHLQSRNSNLKTAAVLNTLVKCRQTKRKLIDSGDRLELPYQSRQFIQENIDVFKSTALKWARVGPVATCFLVGPMWMGWLTTLYVCLQPHSFGQAQTLNLYQFLTRCFESLGGLLSRKAGLAYDSLQQFAINPVVTFITTVSIFLFVLYLLRLMWKPNFLVADKSGIKLVLRFAEISVPIGSVPWTQVCRAELFKQGSKTGVLRITKTNGKRLDIDLSALAPEDRSSLLKRMEKFVPNNQIDHELSQAMLPKSERSYTEIWLQSLNQPPERKTLDPLEPGQIVGDNRFEVLKSIGVGGQGKAYLCRNLDLAETNDDSVIVLKETIIPIFADSSVRRKALESFEKEASLLKSLESDGIVKLIDYFVEDHRAYLVLEHVDGCNLRDLVLRDGPLPEEQVWDLALQMCDILSFLHANSVVHRDFTPDNLILNSKGKLKLIDFNVAQQIQSGSTGTIVGKHAYLPPEQFRGKTTSQSDLYAFGATLFFLLTGRDPEPISQSAPVSINENVGDGLNEIVKRATALQAAARYETASQIHDDLLHMQEAPRSLSTKVTTKVEVKDHG